MGVRVAKELRKPLSLSARSITELREGRKRATCEALLYRRECVLRKTQRHKAVSVLGLHKVVTLRL